MVTLSDALKFYKREDIQKEIIREAKDKEVGMKFGDKGFGKRPDILKYPGDVLELAKKGITSFHISEELWNNPLLLDPNMKKKDLEDLKKGWDIVLDIDCKFIEYSKIAADLLVKALRYNKIRCVSVKFSGNKGFHIGVPFEAFPERINDCDVRLMFPEAAKRIALYLKDLIKIQLERRVLELEGGDFNKVVEKVGLDSSEIIRKEKNEFGDEVAKLDCERFLEIDTILISSRHLYRSAYSFNEKSGLVSISIDPDKVMEFEKVMAKPESVNVGEWRFLDREKAIAGEAEQLFREAFDHKPEIKEGKKEEKEYEDIGEAVPEELFPPCVKKILCGLEDGRKRSLFVMTNFLTCLGWEYDEIKNRIKEWNKKNAEPLREVLVKGQIRYHKRNKKKILPPNCGNSSYYKDLGVCMPDNLCGKIKNPVSYSKRKVFGSRRK